MKKILLLISLFITLNNSAQVKILFDNTKAETAGNADWVIDADNHNLGFFSSNNYLPSTGGSDSNAQRIPNPAQSGITASTVESYWTGALSSWGIDCVKAGYTVESLPYNGQITYGNSSNAQDLSNYKVFVVDEPNILFTASEKVAIINFVNNGGGLCMISDHDISDRNNDTYDSPHIWNDLMSNNTAHTDPFGITFDYLTISGTYSNIAPLATNTVLHGTAGNVTQVKWTSGTTMTLNTTNNASAKGLIYKTGTSGLTNVMVAQATYGTGKIIAIGDSSIPDDGSGDPGDTLYDGYITDAAGNHQKLLMNATIWLATTTLATENNEFNDANFKIIPNPINDKLLQIHYNITNDSAIIIYDAVGREIKKTNLSSSFNSISISLNELNSGVYFCKVYSENSSKTIPFIIK